MNGIDIVYIEKFSEKANKNYFLNKVFTDSELKYSSNKSNMMETLAGIYAAKEATIKAYDLNLSYIIRKRIEICHEKDKPILYIDNIRMNASISISHDKDYAISTCSTYDNTLIKNIDREMKKILPKREQNTNKSSYGKIAIIGGSEGMAGSVYMSSLAAMRSGAGLTYILAPKSISEILQIKANEEIIKKINCDNFTYSDLILEEIFSNLDDKDVLIMGPGMGNDEKLNILIGKILNGFNKRILIDADGLNQLSKDLDILNNTKDIVLTPHIMEFSRLTKLSIDDINKNREEIAVNFSKKHHVILVLKSENTIVTNGEEIYINKIGNPGMATAGMGDVLTGIIGAFLARLDPYKAAILGVYLHSLAGDIAKNDLGEDSIIATDIIKYIPNAFKLLR